MADKKSIQRTTKNHKAQAVKERDVFMKLGAKLRAYFFTGILVTAPIAITFYMAYKFIVFVDRSVNKLIPPHFMSDYMPFTIPGLGLVVLIVAMILVGMFAAGFMGRFFIRLGEWIVCKMPFISSIYSLLKQIFETFLSNKKQSFNKVVLFEYPRKGIWILGFVSSETKGEVKHILKEDMVNVFVPTTPNPTSGFFIFVPKKDVTELKMTVEEGLKFIISCGIVDPDEFKKRSKI